VHGRVLLPYGRRRTLDRLVRPTLQRTVAQFADFVEHGLFGRIPFGVGSGNVLYNIE
jgi:hypothetical protein